MVPLQCLVLDPCFRETDVQPWAEQLPCPDSVFEPTHFGVALRMSLVGLAEADDDNDLLDDYIEAQVHGPLLLAHDVEALVLDPCFRDTDV